MKWEPALEKADKVLHGKFSCQENPVVPASANDSILQKLLSPKACSVFSGIYENLVTGDTSTQGRVVLVCCPSRGEGATTVASGLAVAAASQSHRPVLLIDGNWRHPKLSEIFGAQGAGGLSEILSGMHMKPVTTGVFRVVSRGANDLVSGRIDPLSVLAQTSIDNLWLMNAGENLQRHVQALEYPHFRNVLDELLTAYPFIIVDGPDVLTYPDSILYASQVDRVLLVVHAGVTRTPVASKALAKLNAVGSRVEIILNRRLFAIPQSIYRRL